MHQLERQQNPRSQDQVDTFVPDQKEDVSKIINHCDHAIKNGQTPKIPTGIDILRTTESGRSNFRCAQFVFATVRHESWAQEDLAFPHELFSDTHEYLKRRGYERLEEHDKPKSGDIVAYGEITQKRQVTIHFGCWDEGKVISKYGIIPIIFRHTVSMVPKEIGYQKINNVIFFRKTKNIYAVQAEQRPWGFYLPVNEARQRFDRAENDVRTLKELQGVTLYDRLPHEDRYQDSATFLFSTLLQEPWYIWKDEEPLFFTQNPILYLKKYGWDFVPTPNDGDIVLYNKELEPTINRFGLWTEGNVLSKSHFAPVYHNFDFVPNLDGNAVRFMRKII